MEKTLKKNQSWPEQIDQVPPIKLTTFNRNNHSHIFQQDKITFFTDQLYPALLDQLS